MIVIPMTLLLDVIFLSNVPSLLKMAGSALVLVGTATVAVCTWWMHRQEGRHRLFRELLDFPVKKDGS
ncbi:Hypp8098 [Branchiostoma lanceolatum]|uniref:Hypp8098 protein n=1 Tax=Branchiostoma lanceolatum TaxID=7740 RepID=A0A8J9Z5Q2_BRALA|nr:Hypp8098 [Branchiostoma lanceolatum]